jgi:hypothetical protein
MAKYVDNAEKGSTGPGALMRVGTAKFSCLDAVVPDPDSLHRLERN